MATKDWNKKLSGEDDGRYGNQRMYTRAQVELMNEMRMLWEQHVYWTRMAIVSIASGAPDEELVTCRLLRNAADMGTAIRPFYGREASTEYTRLLREHIVLAAHIVEASKAGDRRSAARAERQWYRNADDIAAFWHNINPRLSERALREMLHEHLGLVKAAASARLSGRYARDIALQDKIEFQALEMADDLSTGIIAQFPETFAREDDEDNDKDE